MSVSELFRIAFIEKDRWKLYLQGLGITIEVSIFAAMIGLVLGTIAALMKLHTNRSGKITIFGRIADVYIDVIRGTPSVLQLMIMWFITDSRQCAMLYCRRPSRTRCRLCAMNLSRFSRRPLLWVTLA